MKYMLFVSIISFSVNVIANDNSMYFSHDGKGNKTVCFDRDTATFLLKCEDDLAMREKISCAVEKDLMVLNNFKKKCTDLNNNLESQIKVLNELVYKQQQQVDNDKKWYNNKYFWAVAGFVFGFISFVSVSGATK